MTDKDKLIELLYDVLDARPDTIADHLLANGVIVPPCKVGDKVYQTDGIRIYESEVTEIYQDRTATIIYNTNGIAFDERAIGTSVFLTKEEAEVNLRERKEDEGN